MRICAKSDTVVFSVVSALRLGRRSDRCLFRQARVTMETVSLTRRVVRRNMRGSYLSGDGVKRRSPLEQAIAEKTDRRARHEAKLRRQGMKKTSVWVREGSAAELLLLVKAVNQSDDEKALSALRRCREELVR